MFISNYNFYSTILAKPLNSPNRWFGGNVAHPSKDNQYYKDYLKFNYNIINKKKVEMIYIDIDLIDYQKVLYNDVLKFFPSNCAKVNIIKEILLAFDISNCYR